MVTRNYCCIAAAIFFALFSCRDLLAGQAKPPVPLSVQVFQKKLLIAQGKDRQVFDLSDLVEGYELNQGKLRFENSDDKFRYLVVYISGPSRSPIAAQSFCGAGTEGYLLWLALDSRWRLRKRQSALLESCFQSAKGVYEIKANRLSAEWYNYRLEKHFTLAYDSFAPARGFSITESKIEPAK